MSLSPILSVFLIVWRPNQFVILCLNNYQEKLIKDSTCRGKTFFKPFMAGGGNAWGKEQKKYIPFMYCENPADKMFWKNACDLMSSINYNYNARLPEYELASAKYNYFFLSEKVMNAEKENFYLPNTTKVDVWVWLMKHDNCKVLLVRNAKDGWLFWKTLHELQAEYETFMCNPV